MLLSTLAGLSFSLQAQQTQTILVVGDSLSAAYNMPIEQGWVALMETRLAREVNQTTRVVNFSISGDTTAGGLARLPDALKRHQPDILILELGANDGLQGKSLKQMKRNLAEMIRLAQAQDVQVLLMDMQLPPNYGPLFNQKFQQVYGDLAEQFTVGLIPFPRHIAERGDLKQADGLHPTAAAQPMVLQSVWPHVLTQLGEEVSQ